VRIEVGGTDEALLHDKAATKPDRAGCEPCADLANLAGCSRTQGSMRPLELASSLQIGSMFVQAVWRVIGT